MWKTRKIFRPCINDAQLCRKVYLSIGTKDNIENYYILKFGIVAKWFTIPIEINWCLQIRRKTVDWFFSFPLYFLNQWLDQWPIVVSHIQVLWIMSPTKVVAVFFLTFIQKKGKEYYKHIDVWNSSLIYSRSICFQCSQYNVFFLWNIPNQIRRKRRIIRRKKTEKQNLLNMLLVCIFGQIFFQFK